MRGRINTATPVRTQADKKAEAIRFVWEAADRVIRSTTADQLARMKGVTGKSDIAEIAGAIGARIGGMA